MTPGRTAPCPCGSGRKYKRCCAARDAAARAEAGDTFADFRGGTPEDEPSRYFGYDASIPADASPFDLPEQGLVCLAFRVGPDDLEEMRAQMSFAFKLGDWAVSTGAHERTVVHGPFPTVDAAFDFARTRAGAVRFFSDLAADFL